MSSELNQMSAVQVAPSGERSQGRGRYGVVCRGNPVWSIPERLELKFHKWRYTLPYLTYAAPATALAKWNEPLQYVCVCVCHVAAAASTEWWLMKRGRLTRLRRTDMVLNQFIIHRRRVSHWQRLVFLHLASEHPSTAQCVQRTATHTYTQCHV